MDDQINENEIIPSVLEVKASGVDVSNDLLIQDGKSIAELLDDQENKPK